jgi:hypothetical protein
MAEMDGFLTWNLIVGALVLVLAIGAYLYIALELRSCTCKIASVGEMHRAQQLLKQQQKQEKTKTTST